MSHITKIHNGWISNKLPTKYIYTATYKNDFTPIRDYGTAPADDKTFTVASTTTVTSTVHGRADGRPVLSDNQWGTAWIKQGLHSSCIE